MDNKEKENLVLGYESALNYFARIIKWLIIVIVLLVLLLFGTNLAWTIYENQFEEVSSSEENTVFALQSGDDNTVVGCDMNVTNGNNEE